MTIKELRKMFWAEVATDEMRKEYRSRKTQNDYSTDVRSLLSIMKTNNEKLLKEIYVMTEDQKIKDKVLQILRIEQSQAKGKFDYYKFVSKDELRQVLTGVYHDYGFKVATDAFILVAIKDEYDESELEGKVVGKDGAFIDGKYPNWRSVIPDFTSNKHGYRTETVKIDFDKWMKFMQMYKADKKLNQEKMWVKVGSQYYNVILFNLLTIAMRRLGVNEITNSWTQYGPTAGVCNGSDGSIALLMPTFRRDIKEYYVFK